MDFYHPQSMKLHFTGIGGVGMTALAWLLRDLGWEISGSDLVDFRMRKKLEQKGITVHIGHSVDWLKHTAALIHSSAIPLDHLELNYARLQNIPIYERMEAIRSLLTQKKLVGITGSYGKSTCTTFVASMMQQAKLHPSWLIGADLMDFPPAKYSKDSFLVLECDESKPQFLSLNPFVALITNVGKDHLHEYHYSSDHLAEAFFQFARRVPSTGTIIVCGDDTRLLELKNRINHCKVITCGSDLSMDYSCQKVQTYWKDDAFSTHFDVCYQGGVLFNAQISMPGTKNAIDALMAYASIKAISNEPIQALDASYFLSLPVMDRRMEIKGTYRDCLILDDEGDSPDVIRGGMQILRKLFPEKRIVAIIQPHRFTRLTHLMDDYVDAIHETVDDLVLMPVYAAGESYAPDRADSKLLAEKLKDLRFKGQIFLVNGCMEAVSAVHPYLLQQTVVVTLGPGDVWRVGDELLAILQKI